MFQWLWFEFLEKHAGTTNAVLIQICLSAIAFAVVLTGFMVIKWWYVGFRKSK